MESENVETKEMGENKEFTREEIEKIKKVVESDKDAKVKFLRQVKSVGNNKELEADALRLVEEVEEVEKILDK